jgi:hypothetical protein
MLPPNKIVAVMISLLRKAPSSTATTGFTNAYVATKEIGALSYKNAYALYAIAPITEI